MNESLGARGWGRGWGRAAAVYRDPRVLAITFLGFSSGLPLGILGDPLTAWLAEDGVAKTTIGLFALASLPYSLKFLWAPVIDRAPFPLLTRWLGRRRGWAIATQLMLLLFIFLLGQFDPGRNLGAMATVAFLIAFTSASQDVVIDAYRVEILDEEKLGAGAATIVLGYRVGQVGAGAVGLIVAAAWGWAAAFAVMAALVVVGVIAVLLNPEPALVQSADSHAQEDDLARRMASWSDWIARAVIAPLADFLTRPGWIAILAFIVFYKLGDAVLSVMQTPFFLEIGFTKLEIAGIKKGVGFAAIVGGGVVGGLLVARYGIMRSLLVAGILQALSNLVFVYQAWAGHDLGALTVTVAAENIATGMGTTAFVAYLSSLCNVAYTATQYALLTSIMGGARTALSASAGWFADQMDWIPFFVLTTVAALPGLVLLVWMIRRYPAPHLSGTAIDPEVAIDPPAAK